MPVEFLGIAATNDGSEITARSGASFDKDYTLSLARAHEEHGWDRVLFAYGSGSPDPNAAAAYIASKTGTLQLLLAHRPNVSYPTFAAKTFATIDQISDGRVTVHFITGGTDHEQQREGDYLSHDERYARTGEYMAIVKQAWTAREPFDHTGPHYTFANFVSDVFPVQAPRPRLSFGGSSPAAYRVGGAEADIYCLWGEPLASTAEQIASVKAAARAAGRADVPKIQVAFRPINLCRSNTRLGGVTCTVGRHGGCSGGWLAGCCSRSLTCSRAGCSAWPSWCSAVTGRRMSSCSCSGMRTRCCAGMPAGYGTSRTTGCGSLRWHGSCRASAGPGSSP